MKWEITYIILVIQVRTNKYFFKNIKIVVDV